MIDGEAQPIKFRLSETALLQIQFQIVETKDVKYFLQICQHLFVGLGHGDEVVDVTDHLRAVSEDNVQEFGKACC